MDRLEEIFLPGHFTEPQYVGAATSPGLSFPFTRWGLMAPASCCTTVGSSDLRLAFIFMAIEHSAERESAFQVFLFTEGKTEALRIKCLALSQVYAWVS